ncbi:unnamed protein product [Rotaria sordida]|uniref:Uncharacterized protein n=1 Tax=Rotaria sordida TaxID=392033 RepID=A0A818MAM4_9BILA|nr:unnamed protein product [Rotaria sordida]CAF3587822.1 unnamed protein product [Rotaria sordida]
MIQQTMSISCQRIQIAYKAKFISKSNDYILIEKKSFINWFDQKFTQMNIRFPWNLIGQQLDEDNNKSFLIQFTFQLVINTLQSVLDNDYYSKKRKACHILCQCIYSVFLICLSLTSGFLLWMIIIIIEGITIERKIHDYIEKSSLELISFIEHTAFITNCFFNSIEINDDKFESTLITNETLHTNFDLKFALNGVSFLTNIFHDLSIHLKNLKNLFHFWFMFTKFVILLPHVAGACSACNDLKQKQVYNSLLFASKWFNSTFLIAMNNEPIDIDQLIEKCKQNLPLLSINDFIRLALLENKMDKIDNINIDKMNIEDIDLNQYHLFHYLITSIITTISHLLLYLITILLHRCIQNYKYKSSHLKFSFQSSPILTTNHSMIIPSNQNQQDEIETKIEYQNHPIIIQ